MSYPISRALYTAPNQNSATLTVTDNPFFQYSVRGLDSGFEQPSNQMIDDEDAILRKRFRIGQRVRVQLRGKKPLTGRVLAISKDSTGIPEFLTIIDDEELKIKIPVSSAIPLQPAGPHAELFLNSPFIGEQYIITEYDEFERLLDRDNYTAD